jgi:hypothetical protein
MMVKPLEEQASDMCCRETARPWPPGRRLYHASNMLTETRGARGAEVCARGGVAVDRASRARGSRTRASDIGIFWQGDTRFELKSRQGTARRKREPHRADVARFGIIEQGGGSGGGGGGGVRQRLQIRGGGVILK